jgi:secreted PhoX family phosphatase
MHERMDRRAFLQAAGVVSAGFVGLRHAIAREGGAAAPRLRRPVGPLRSDPGGIFDLPEGFGYRVISRVGDRMSDGLIVPGAPDGMAAFPGPEGLTLIVRNHECETVPAMRSPLGLSYELRDKVDLSRFYDAGHGKTPAHGGTSTIVYDTKTGRVRSEFLSLGGTVRNCAGGPTPWGSWLTCEESVQRKSEVFEQDHGWIFEVPATAEPLLHKAEPLLDMGRFNHEAVAVDPRTGIVYLTEDRDDALIYRFIPKVPGELARGGRLQMLAVADRPSIDTRNHGERTVEVGARLPVRWMDCRDVHAPDDTLRTRGAEAGAAVFARGEGIAWSAEGIYIVCTSGGRAQRGQVWRLRPGGSADPAEAGGTLELFIEPNDASVLDMPDNCTVSPWGDLVLCEDGPGPSASLLGVTGEGAVYRLGRNAAGSSELAGATFSPDGSTLFVNMQKDGMTLAITGPWPEA